jgi:hypothetical protein
MVSRHLASAGVGLSRRMLCVSVLVVCLFDRRLRQAYNLRAIVRGRPGEAAFFVQRYRGMTQCRVSLLEFEAI